MKTSVVGGREDLGHAARGRPVQLVRNRHRRALVDHGELRLGRRRRRCAITRSPGSKRPTRRPRATTSPANARPGMLAGAPGRRGVVSDDLEHVGAVEAGAADTDEDLPSWGSGSGCSATSRSSSRGWWLVGCKPRLLPVRLWCAAAGWGTNLDVAVPLPHFFPAMAEKVRGGSSRRPRSSAAAYGGAAVCPTARDAQSS